MPGDRPRFRPGTPVRAVRQSVRRANLSIFDDPIHEHRGDVGRVTDVEETSRAARYEVRFDPYGDERTVFEEAELEPAPPRKT